MILTLDVHDDNIRTNLPDVFIGNAVVRFAAQKVQELVSVWNKQLADLTAAFIKFKVGHLSEPLTVPKVNNILAL